METGIAILDTLLGVGQKSRLLQKPPLTQTMLIRGAPGSGKTTLAVEILARQVTKDPPVVGFFLSLEVDPEQAWRTIVDRLAPELREKARTRKVVFGDRKWLDDAVTYGHWLVVEQHLTTQFAKLVNAASNSMADFCNCKQGLIIVDSVNVLADIVQHKMSSPDRPADMRTVMYGIWSVLEKQRTAMERSLPCNLILIGEYHPNDFYGSSLLSESFACDIELLLMPEPIAGTPTIPTNLLSPLGYAFERRQRSGTSEMERHLGGETQSVEIRSFCRVLKSRFTANQSRRCAYDIVTGEGLKFEERYPGDGALLLFCENSKQRALWHNFLTYDVPLQFPALRYALFDRPGLQRTFATQRQFNQLHQKTDLQLASFDSYWVNWYWQQGQRSHLRALISADFPQTRAYIDNSPQGRKHWSQFLCGIDEFAIGALTRHSVGSMSKAYVNELNTALASDICEPWLADAQTNCTMSRDEVHKKVFAAINNAAIDLKNGSVGLLQSIPRQKVRLFGECQSQIIKELEQPAHRVHLPRYPDTDHFLTIPYNANISLLICREDLLRKRRTLQEGDSWRQAREKLLIRQHKAIEVFEHAQKARRAARAREGCWKYAIQPPAEQCRIGTADSPLPTANGVTSPPLRQAPASEPEATNGRIAQETAVQTWEDLILLCTEGHYEDGGDAATAHLVIETQTYDSFLCAFLEVFWGCGGELNVNARYEIDNVFRAEKKLFHAFFLLREMFRLGVIEQYSTLDPKKFGKRYPALGKQSSDHKDWLFARHWYSTFVDVLTDLRETGTGYSWEPGPDVELMIQPLPFSAFSVQELTAGLGAGLESPNDQFAAQGTATRHPMISCWGEWHFAVLNGTENQALAIEIINHLMSSNAVCERAARCAALPTVEEFYKRYADVPCLRLPEREDVKIQRLTYRQLRDRFFRIAKTRRSVFDYRHCLREIHSVLTLIQHIATTISDAHLADEVLNAVDRIHLLQYQEMLIH